MAYSARYFCAVILDTEASTEKSYTVCILHAVDNDAKGTQKRTEWVESEAHQVQSQASEEKVHQIRGSRTSGFHVGCATLRKFSIVQLVLVPGIRIIICGGVVEHHGCLVEECISCTVRTLRLEGAAVE